MAHDFTKHSPRRPRFAAVDNASFWAAIRRSETQSSAVLPADLRDFSRGGFSFEIESPLEPGEEITLELFDEASEYEVSVPGTVRWIAPTQGQTWLVGCQADAEIDWITIGELLLNKLLLPDESLD